MSLVAWSYLPNYTRFRSPSFFSLMRSFIEVLSKHFEVQITWYELIHGCQSLNVNVVCPPNIVI